MGKLGINAKLYYKSGGTDSAPTWTEIDCVSDLAVNPTWDEAEADDRSDRVHRVVKSMMGLEVTGTVKVKLGNAAYEALADAVVGDTVLDVMVLTGPKETQGERGWRFDSQVFAANQDQAKGNVLFDAITIKPTDSDHKVRAVKVGAGGSLTYSTVGGTPTFAAPS